MLTQQLFVHGLAFWSPLWPDWPSAAAALRGESGPPPAAPQRPRPTLIGANERRRAPDSVLMALQVAQEACAAANIDPASLPSVFTSSYGDLAIVDALCRTLAQEPQLLSPLRFHHSVHNAASGYWAIGSGCPLASTAVAAGAHSFAAGWLEAASQCAADQSEVLLVACDTEAVGALQAVNSSRGQLAAGLVLGPVTRGTGSRAIHWSLQPGAWPAPALRSDAARQLQHNASADALPLFEALARRQPASLMLPLSDSLALGLELQAL